MSREQMGLGLSNLVGLYSLTDLSDPKSRRSYQTGNYFFKITDHQPVFLNIDAITLERANSIFKFAIGHMDYISCGNFLLVFSIYLELNKVVTEIHHN